MTDANLTHVQAKARTQALELSTYRLHLDLSQAADMDRATFPVTMTVDFTTADPELFLDYLGESVSSVTVNGAETAPDFDGGRIHLHELPTGQPLSVTVKGNSRYSRTGQGLHRMQDAADGQVYLYSHLEPSDARRIFPCFDQPDLKAIFHTTMTAPAGWAILSNQPETSRTSNAGETSQPATETVEFAPTPKLSTYLTSFAAGPYTSKHRTWTAPDGSLTVELGAWGRKSMEDYLDDEILELTAQGMDFFHTAYEFPYPWGKYDSIFVPEYNLGAMENPGLVTFTETYLFRSKATRAQHAGRTNTILHEMSHMWFGDLVTPRWWDDLWLKESFAEFMGADSSVNATQYTEAWTNFAGKRKNWAYAQDQLPTTHPIKAEIPDVDAARQNFDGITYAKGASVLKQLVHFVGRDNFYAGARDYFAAHAFDAATFDDLLEALRPHTDRDLDAWANAWLRTWGPDTLTPEVSTHNGTITELAIDATAEDSTRPHRINVTLFDSELAPLHTLDVDLPVTGGRTVVEEAAGLKAPALVLLNDADHTYAKVRFDATSLETLMTSLSKVDNELSRAVIWTALWNLTRDGQWPATNYVDTVVKHAVQENNPELLTTAFANAGYAVAHFTPEAQRDVVRANYADRVWDLLQAAEPGSDSQLVLTRAAISSLAGTPDGTGTERLRAILNGDIAGLELGPEIRWATLRALTARDETTQEELDAEKHLDNTLTGAAAHLGATYSVPNAQTKRQVFDLVREPGTWSNSEVDSLLAAFNAPRSGELTEHFAEEFFSLIPEIWEQHPIEIANRIVRGLYPELPQALEATDAFLKDTEEVPGALRRVLLECQDTVRRNLSVQEANA